MNIALGSLIKSTTTILSGVQPSSAIPTAGLSLVGITMPAAFTGTTLTFESSDTAGGAYQPIVGQDGNAISYTVAQGKYVAIDPKPFAGVLFLKIVSGSAEGADRSLNCAFKGI